MTETTQTVETPVEENVCSVAPEEAVAEKQEAPETDWQDKAMRLAAEMENLRKRTARDVEEARKYAVTNFARDMLTVQDNLQRALAEMDKDGADVAQLKEGVKLVAEGLTGSFERFGIKKIEAMGQKLDPQQHQVMMEMPAEGVEPGTVAQVMQEGYMMADRLLRPSMVGVAKAES